MAVRFLDWDGLREQGVPFSKTHIDRLVKQERFPKPVKFGSGPNAMKRWLASEIEEYMARKIAERGSKYAPEMQPAE